MESLAVGVLRITPLTLVCGSLACNRVAIERALDVGDGIRIGTSILGLELGVTFKEDVEAKAVLLCAELHVFLPKSGTSSKTTTRRSYSSESCHAHLYTHADTSALARCGRSSCTLPQTKVPCVQDVQDPYAAKDRVPE